MNITLKAPRLASNSFENDNGIVLMGGTVNNVDTVEILKGDQSDFLDFDFTPRYRLNYTILLPL